MMTDLATMLRDRLGLAEPAPVEIRRGDVQEFDGFFRERIEYRGLEGDLIPAFLFTPKGRDTLGGVVVFAIPLRRSVFGDLDEVVAHSSGDHRPDHRVAFDDEVDNDGNVVDLHRLADGDAGHVELVGHGADTSVFTPVGETPHAPRPYAVYAGTASEAYPQALLPVGNGLLVAVTD